MISSAPSLRSLPKTTRQQQHSITSTLVQLRQYPISIMPPCLTCGTSGVCPTCLDRRARRNCPRVHTSSSPPLTDFQNNSDPRDIHSRTQTRRASISTPTLKIPRSRHHQLNTPVLRATRTAKLLPASFPQSPTKPLTALHNPL